MAIEVDGGVHYYDSRIVFDKQRVKDREALGVKVLRDTNSDVIKNINSVLQDIITKTTPLSPPSQGGDKRGGRVLRLCRFLLLKRYRDRGNVIDYPLRKVVRNFPKYVL